MTLGKTLTLTLAAGAVALVGFAAAPARADDRALWNLLAGAAAIAIIVDSTNGDHHRYRDGDRWEDHRDRWHHRNRGYGYGYGYGYGDDGGRWNNHDYH